MLFSPDPILLLRQFATFKSNQKNQMLFAEALHDILAYIPANQVLNKGILLEVAIQDGQMEVKEAKQTQKVSTSL